jgi:hypothetical protein
MCPYISRLPDSSSDRRRNEPVLRSFGLRRSICHRRALDHQIRVLTRRGWTSLGAMPWWLAVGSLRWPSVCVVGAAKRGCWCAPSGTRGWQRLRFSARKVGDTMRWLTTSALRARARYRRRKKSVAGGDDFFLFLVVIWQNRQNFSSLTGHPSSTFESSRYNFSSLYFTGVLDPSKSRQAVNTGEYGLF